MAHEQTESEVSITPPVSDPHAEEAATPFERQVEPDSPSPAPAEPDAAGVETPNVDEAKVDEAAEPQPPEAEAPEPPILEERVRTRDVPEGIEARIELYHSHAFLKVEALLKSFGEGFNHAEFDRLDGNDLLTDEYDNGRFHVTYCLHEHGRDELRVRWSQQLENAKRNDNELLGLARQLAHLLGGGTNLRLLDERSAWRKRGTYTERS